MITDVQKTLMLEEYSKRGILKKEIRSYEVSLWTLQDSFITVLKWSDVEQRGRIEHPKMTLNIDGTQDFTFSIPMYYRTYFNTDESLNGKLIFNPNWYSTRNGNLMASMRKVKVIFNKGEPEEAVFEFLIVDVKESHEKDIATCELKCEGLAFHELGKIGYTYALSQELFELDYEKWEKALDGSEPPIQNVDYWCNKIHLEKYPTNAALINPRTWYYKVDMLYSSYGESSERESDKVYEEAYTESWSNQLIPQRTKEYIEKARPISIENSNIYNITQTIAEKFNIFCKYDYGYDENYHIISRCITFYNNYFQEDKGALSFMYPHSSTKIVREMDATNLITKMYVSDVDDDTVYDGYHSIMNVKANKTRENYILNFEYMHQIGAINEEQYESIKPFEIKIAGYNKELLQLQNNLAAYNEKLPEIEAQIAVLNGSIDIATEEISKDNRLKNALDLSDGDADGFISVTNSNPEQKIIIQEKGKNIIRIDDVGKNIIVNSINIYKLYNSSTQTLTNPISSFSPIYDSENGNLIQLEISAQTGSQIVYLTYKYNPTLYYDKIIKVWEEKLWKDTNDRDKLQEELGEKNETTGEGESGLYRLITDTSNRINELLELKGEAIREFERMMGPALREGYWQPEDYKDYGDQRSFSHSLTLSSPIGQLTLDAEDSAIVGWDTELFDGEDNLYYEEGIEQSRVYYPAINLNTLYDSIHSNLDEYSFIFNNNYYDNSANLNEIKNIQVYKIGSQALFKFVKQGEYVFPALILVGAKNLTFNELQFMREHGNPRIAKINTAVTDQGVTTTITNAINVSNNSYWQFNGTTINGCEIVYPRVKFSSLALKTDSINFVMRYNNILLNQFVNYYFNTRTVERGDNYYPEYFVTIKPEIIFKYGINGTIGINYVLSNADTSIYLDALEVSKENAFPKVSYEITPNILNPNLSHILYDKLAQIVMVNDVDLKFENVFGYISVIDLDLDDVSKDTITIQNYKTKFEDLFSNIVAQTEAIKHAGPNIDAALMGNVPLSKEALVTTIEQNNTIFNSYFNSSYENSELVAANLASVDEKLMNLFDEAGRVIKAVSSSVSDLSELNAINNEYLASFKTNVAASLRPNEYSGTQHAALFKKGDIWLRNGTGVETATFIATRNWDEVYTDETTAQAGVSSTNGWNRISSENAIADIRGAALNIDTVNGNINIEAQNNINVRAGALIDMIGNNIEITATKVNGTGGNLNLSGDTSVNIASGGGIYLVTSNNYTGTQAVSIDSNGIDLASNSDINLRSGGSINIYSANEINASAFRINNTEGIWVGTNQKIDFAATDSNGGSALTLNKDRILMGVTSTIGNAGVVDIKNNEIILGVAQNLQGLENTDNILLNGTVSGVQIKKDYIAFSATANDRRSIVSVAPNRLFIGSVASNVTGNNIDSMINTSGAYIDINNSGTAPDFEIGSAGRFAVLTPTFTINNTASGANNMLYLADNATWESANSGMRFSQTNGLEIKAKNIGMTAGNINLTGEGSFSAVGANVSIKSSDSTYGLNFPGNGDYILWAGNATPSSAPFYLKKDGSIKSTSGIIGPWNFTSDAIYKTDATFGSSNGMYFGNSGISLGEDFKVKPNGDVYINSLMVFDPDGEIYPTTQTDKRDGDYARIQFSDLNFKQAVQGTPSWNGNVFSVKVSLWGAINKTLSYNGSFRITSASVDSMIGASSGAAAQGHATIMTLIAGQEVSLENQECQINCWSAYEAGWKKAVSLISPTTLSNETAITIPKSDANGGTTIIDLSPIINAATAAYVSTGTVYTVPSDKTLYDIETHQYIDYNGTLYTDGGPLNIPGYGTVHVLGSSYRSKTVYRLKSDSAVTPVAHTNYYVKTT